MATFTNDINEDQLVFLAKATFSLISELVSAINEDTSMEFFKPAVDETSHIDFLADLSTSPSSSVTELPEESSNIKPLQF